MRLFYIFPEELPSKKARAISVVNTAAALSQMGHCSLCTVDTKTKTVEKSLASYYNIDSSKLEILPIKKTFLGIKSNYFFNVNLKKHLENSPDAVFYVRHLKAAQYLIKHKQPSQRIIFECHEIFYQTLQEESPSKEKKISMLKSIETFVYNFCDGIVFTNKTLQSHFNKIFVNAQKRQKVVYNGMQYTAPYIQKDFTNLDSIFYIGNFFQWKGVQDAIQALTGFLQMHLHLIGGDSEKRVQELKELIETLSLSSNVLLHGYKSSQEVQKILLEKAKLTIIPNTKSIQNQFSMPIKLFEYMATSNLIIASNMDTIKEIIDDEYNGFLFESGNIHSLQQTIEKILKLPQKTLETISKNAYETSKQFTWENRAKEIVSFAKEVLQ